MNVKMTGAIALGSEFAAGYDLIAQTGWILHPGERWLVPTGVKLEMPDGLAALVVPRSGMAWKDGITVLNAPGLIDPDYRGEIKVNLFNASERAFAVHPGMRVAQLMFVPFVRPHFTVVADLSATARGEGGHGSTGA